MAQPRKELGFVENFSLGGAAAVISKTAAAPLERIKLLIQNQDEMIKAGRLDRPYKGVVHCTAWVFKNEGNGWELSSMELRTTSWSNSLCFFSDVIPMVLS